MVNTLGALRNMEVITYLFRDPPSHVPLRALKGAESLAKVELNVIPLTFHAYTKQKSSLSIQIEPVLSREEIAEMNGIQLDRRSANVIVITHCIPIPDRSNDIQRALCGDIDSIFPPRVEVVVDNARLCNPLLVLVSQDHVRIAATIHVAGFQVFCLHHFDCEDICSGFADFLELRWGVLCDYFGTCIDVDFALEPI